MESMDPVLQLHITRIKNLKSQTQNLHKIYTKSKFRSQVIPKVPNTNSTKYQKYQIPTSDLTESTKYEQYQIRTVPNTNSTKYEHLNTAQASKQ